MIIIAWEPVRGHFYQEAYPYVFIPFLTAFWIRILDMDRRRKKVAFSWLRTTVTSPAHHQGGNADSVTPPCRTITQNEDSETLPCSDSPGSAQLGALSLDTPKRKAEVLSESLPSVGKLKLRKLSRKNSETFKTLKVNLCHWIIILDWMFWIYLESHKLLGSSEYIICLWLIWHRTNLWTPQPHSQSPKTSRKLHHLHPTLLSWRRKTGHLRRD